MKWWCEKEEIKKSKSLIETIICIFKIQNTRTKIKVTDLSEIVIFIAISMSDFNPSMVINQPINKLILSTDFLFPLCHSFTLPRGLPGG